MALNYTKTSVQSGFQSTDTIEENFSDLETALADGLSRSGETPNEMSSALDMNSNRILNLPTATSVGEPVTFQQWSGQTTIVEFDGYLNERVLATNGQTAFSLANAYTPGLGALRVFINGVYQDPSAYTETDANTITFSEGLDAGDEVSFVISSFTSAAATGANNITYAPSGTGAVQTNVQAKLRESVSVLDFGAAGDDSTNNTALLQAALNSSADIIYFPSGTYITDTLSIPSNKHLILHDTAVLKMLSSSATKVILNSGNDNIVIEGGQFDNNEVVNSVACQFSGTNCKMLHSKYLGGTGAQIAISLNSTASEVEIAHNNFDSCRFCVLTGGTTSQTSDVWVHHNYASNSTGDFVEINCPAGLARRWSVEDNIAVTGGRDNIGAGFAVGSSGGTSYIDGLIIRNNHFRDWDNHTIHIEDGSQNVIIEGNQIYGAGANSTGAITTPVGIYVASTEGSDRQISNVIISNNIIVGLGDMLHGIFVAGNNTLTNSTIIGNTVENFDGYGIHLSSVMSQGRVLNNSSTGGTGSASGIRVDGTNVLIGMNYFGNNAGYGIDVISGTNIQFVKNQLKSNITGRVQNITNGTDMDWSLQNEAVSSNRSITATVNNLDPLDEAVIVVTSASTTPELTGILAKPNGVLTIYNGTGAASFDILHNNAGSDAANRILTADSSSITLATGKARTFRYINAASRWIEV